MPDESIAKLWGEIGRLNRELDALERKLATLPPEDISQMSKSESEEYSDY